MNPLDCRRQSYSATQKIASISMCLISILWSLVMGSKCSGPLKPSVFLKWWQGLQMGAQQCGGFYFILSFSIWFEFFCWQWPSVVFAASISCKGSYWFHYGLWMWKCELAKCCRYTEVISILFLEIDWFFFWNIAKEIHGRSKRCSTNKVFLSVISLSHLSMCILNAKYFIAWETHHLNFKIIIHVVYIWMVYSLMQWVSLRWREEWALYNKPGKMFQQKQIKTELGIWIFRLKFWILSLQP